MATREKQAASHDTRAAKCEPTVEEHSKSTLGPELEVLWKSNGEAINTIMRTNEAVLRGMIALTQEVFEFGNTRLRENLERTQSLSKCQDMEEALNVNSDFFQSATQEYLSESANLMKLMTDISRECWAPVEDRTRETFAGLGAK